MRKRNKQKNLLELCKTEAGCVPQLRQAIAEWLMLGHNATDKEDRAPSGFCFVDQAEGGNRGSQLLCCISTLRAMALNINTFAAKCIL
ncbi:rCG56090 [Rattus norvegicus]|uniref:RCG56090 n=1 Tax=Rattus norvegicus TaxID=10116 RepID=A6IAH3_RAT|nr:rCG56090 [Rattus norvegicus]